MGWRLVLFFFFYILVYQRLHTGRLDFVESTSFGRRLLLIKAAIVVEMQNLVLIERFSYELDKR